MKAQGESDSFGATMQGKCNYTNGMVKIKSGHPKLFIKTKHYRGGLNNTNFQSTNFNYCIMNIIML